MSDVVTEKASNRHHTFMLLIYPDDPKYQEYLLAIINSGCRYAYLIHDKDITDDGSYKKPHNHIVVYFQNARSVDGVFSFFNGLIPLNFIQIWRAPSVKKGVARTSDIRSAVRYLCHLDNPEKFVYASEDIKSNFAISHYLNKSSDEDFLGDHIMKLVFDGKIRSEIDLHNPIYNIPFSFRRRAWNMIKDTISVVAYEVRFGGKSYGHFFDDLEEIEDDNFPI